MAEKYIPFEENDDKPTALEMFKEEMRTRKARQQSISAEELEEAISTIINTLRTGLGRAAVGAYGILSGPSGTGGI